MADAVLFPEVKVRVKNTFLEFHEEDDEEEQPRILRYHTDSLTAAARLSAGGAGSTPASASSPFPPAAAAAAAAAPQGSRAEAAAAEAATAEAGRRFEEPPPADGPWPPAAGVGGLAVGAPSASRPRAPAAVAAAQPQASRACGLPVLLGELDPQGRAGRGLAFRAWKPENSWEPEDAEGTAGGGGGPLTTVVLKNVPNDYTRAMLLDLLDSFGFKSRYDFLYLPIDLLRGAGLGYAFVNMLSPADAQLVRERLEGFRQWSVPSSKVCSVGWSIPCQGLDANVERYRNSPIMHSSVPDEFKPVVLVDGVRGQFPRPTKKLRKPDMSYHSRRRAL